MERQLALIIEDDQDAAVIFSKALETINLLTRVISDGQEALDALVTLKPDIILLDLHLPHVDGTEILAYLRKQPHLRDTLVILVTADPRMADMIREQADLVLLKPATFTQIQSFASRLMRRRTTPPIAVVSAPPAA